MNYSKYQPTLCVMADVHLNEIVLPAVDEVSGHEALERLRVTNNPLGGQPVAATLAQAATAMGYVHIEADWEATDVFVSQNTRLTRVGSIYLRYYFVLGANLLRQHNLVYKGHYWRKYLDVSRYQHKRAVPDGSQGRASVTCSAHEE